VDGRIAALLSPLAEAIGRHVRAGPVLYADDTTVQVLTPGLGRPRTGRLWAAVRDERPVRGRERPPAAFYATRPIAKRAWPEGAARQLSRLPCMPTAMPGSTASFALDPKTGAARLTEVGVLGARPCTLRRP